jgi:hypothetical protein
MIGDPPAERPRGRSERNLERQAFNDASLLPLRSTVPKDSFRFCDLVKDVCPLRSCCSTSLAGEVSTPSVSAREAAELSKRPGSPQPITSIVLVARMFSLVSAVVARLML